MSKEGSEVLLRLTAEITPTGQRLLLAKRASDRGQGAGREARGRARAEGVSLGRRGES